MRHLKNYVNAEFALPIDVESEPAVIFMPTPIGAVFLCAAIYCFARRDNNLLPLLVFSGIFQAASVVSSDSFGVQPYYLVAVFFVLRHVLDALNQQRAERTLRGARAAIIFGALGVFSAFCLPLIFQGIFVSDPKLGTEQGLIATAPLHFGIENVAQTAYLIVHIAVVLCCLTGRYCFPSARKAFAMSFYLLVAVIMGQFVCLHLGLPFPNSLFNNNASYGIVNANLNAGLDRPNGTFSEPSMAGAALAMFCGGFLAEYVQGRGTLKLVLLALIASLMVASSSALAALALIILALIAANPVLRFPWYIRVRRLKRMSIFLLVGITLLVMLSIPVLRNSIIAQTIEKGGSLSFVMRTAEDLHAVQVSAATHWIGVGLGSNRPSSLFASLLSNMGLVGLLLFLLMFYQILQNAKGARSWLRWAACSLLLGMIFGIPDVTYPELWIVLALCCAAGGPEITADDVVRPEVHPNTARLRIAQVS